MAQGMIVARESLGNRTRAIRNVYVGLAPDLRKLAGGHSGSPGRRAARTRRAYAGRLIGWDGLGLFVAWAKPGPQSAGAGANHLAGIARNRASIARNRSRAIILAGNGASKQWWQSQDLDRIRPRVWLGHLINNGRLARNGERKVAWD